MKHWLIDNGCFEIEMDKRSYEEMLYANSLDPNMPEDERRQALREFELRPDMDVIEAMSNRYDGASKCEAFVKSLCNAISTDDENWTKKCDGIISALKTNNAQELLIALCGYNAGSLAKRAMVIPDDGREFHARHKLGTVVISWSNGEFSETKCCVDVTTNKVYKYDLNAFKEYERCADIRWVAVKVTPSFGKSEYLRKCITEEEKNATNDYVSYWYSTDPAKSQVPGPDEDINLD